MIAIRIGCHEGPTPTRPDTYPCPYLDLHIETPEELPDAITNALAEHEWTHAPDGYHCPHHHPDLHGLPVTLTHDYTEITPGVQIRLNQQGYARAEVLLGASTPGSEPT